jgi:hypothetical protein
MVKGDIWVRFHVNPNRLQLCIPKTTSRVVRFGLKTVVWIDTVAIYKDKNTVKTVEIHTY